MLHWNRKTKEVAAPRKTSEVVAPRKTRDAIASEIATVAEYAAWSDAHAGWAVEKDSAREEYEYEVDYIDQAKAYDAWQAAPTELVYPDPPAVDPEPQLVDFVDTDRVSAELARQRENQG